MAKKGDPKWKFGPLLAWLVTQLGIQINASQLNFPISLNSATESFYPLQYVPGLSIRCI